ncbi:UdgX family uracil-DNA binding protein [Consotaella aegiceratis]|uniref:UdgX family uracil-DNA binding protein n=1 Tax=Consotaella aegiceratis TaxID=3097961 RepID=UPI002F3F9237
MKLARLAGEADFEGWRTAARTALALGLDPAELVFAVGDTAPELFAEPLPPLPADAPQFTVPRAFPDLARRLICHRHPERFVLAYRLLRRLQDEPKLLDIASDADVLRAGRMVKSIGRDIEKMKSFVRFREIETEAGAHFIAWFEPDHHIVEITAPFFARRFTGMVWTILTPLRSAHWDGERLSFAAGASPDQRPGEDDVEALWLTYYASIFNPARLKVKAMQGQMPKKYWHNLPEATLIPQLVRGAEAAKADMLAATPTLPSLRHERQRERVMATAEGDAPIRGTNTIPDTLDQAREQARQCRACPLWEPATQTVFGRGPEDAPVIFVGEQPGDQEDLAGEPFVGPAGQVFDAALATAGIDRTRTYVTNAVKHFKFVPRGKRRIHQKPNAGEISACRSWLALERRFVQPKLIVALGATAATAVLGKTVTIKATRSRLIDLEDGAQALVTVHPSYILRLPDADAKQREEAAFREDMAMVRRTIPEIALAA